MKLKKYFEWIFPSAVFFIIAIAEGQAYWLAGMALIFWLFYKSVRDLL